MHTPRRSMPSYSSLLLCNQPQSGIIMPVSSRTRPQTGSLQPAVSKHTLTITATTPTIHDMHPFNWHPPQLYCNLIVLTLLSPFPHGSKSAAPNRSDIRDRFLEGHFPMDRGGGMGGRRSAQPRPHACPVLLTHRSPPAVQAGSQQATDRSPVHGPVIGNPCSKWSPTSYSHITLLNTARNV